MRTTDERLDAAQGLLDHQVVDETGALICKVDDVELEERNGELHLTYILQGPGALGARLGAPFGRWMSAIWLRLSTTGEPVRIPMSDVVELSSAVHVAHVDSSSEVQGFERWVREHVVSRLPGGRE
jgi:sporulation protein YlmC with PRC-barrel domain